MSETGTTSGTGKATVVAHKVTDTLKDGAHKATEAINHATGGDKHDHVKHDTKNNATSEHDKHDRCKHDHDLHNLDKPDGHYRDTNEDAARSSLHDTKSRSGSESDGEWFPHPVTGQIDVDPGTHPLSKIPLLETDRLLRVHIISGEIIKSNIKRTPDPLVEVRTSDKCSAVTRVIKNTKIPIWDEQFVIEYDRRDKDAYFKAKIWHKNDIKKRHYIGEWEKKIREIKDYWNETKTIELRDDKDVTAKLSIRLRQEKKREGIVHIRINKIVLLQAPLAETHSFIEFDGDKRVITPKGTYKLDKDNTSAEFESTDYTFEVRKLNNVRDFFVFVVQGADTVGRARLIIRDIAHNDAKGLHTLYNAERICVGTVDLEASFRIQSDRQNYH